MTDVTDQNAWTDASSNTPPLAWTGTNYNTIVSTGEALHFPQTFHGGNSFLGGIIGIPWTYNTGSLGDPGAYINVSLNGGTTWTSHQIAPASGGVNLSGTLMVSLAGATQLLVDVSTMPHP